jgi:hypothetical protein
MKDVVQRPVLVIFQDVIWLSITRSEGEGRMQAAHVARCDRCKLSSSNRFFRDVPSGQLSSSASGRGRMERGRTHPVALPYPFPRSGQHR